MEVAVDIKEVKAHIAIAMVSIRERMVVQEAQETTHTTMRKRKATMGRLNRTAKEKSMTMNTRMRPMKTLKNLSRQITNQRRQVMTVNNKLASFQMVKKVK